MGEKSGTELWVEHERAQRELQDEMFGPMIERERMILAEMALIKLYEAAHEHCKNCRSKHKRPFRKQVMEASEVYSQIRMRRES